MNSSKKQLPNISDAEWEVMNLLWEKHPLSSAELVDSLQHKDWSSKTIKTLIFRLEKKGLISHHEERRGYSYFPLFKKELYVKKESTSLLEKVFGGATSSMLTHFIKEQKLSKKELLEIKKLIKNIEDDSNG